MEEVKPEELGLEEVKPEELELGEVKAVGEAKAEQLELEESNTGEAEAEEPTLELDIKIEAKDLYDYMLRHNYNSASGLLGSGVGALAVVVGAARGPIILLILGVVVLLYLPWTLFIKSRQQALNPVFQEPLHYVLDERGITVSQNGEEQRQNWEDMVKAVSTGRSIIVYTSRINATIFPKRELQDKTADVIQMISTHMPPKKVSIRS